MYKCRSYILAPLAPLLFLLLLLFSLRIRPLKADFSASKQYQQMREEIMGQNLHSDEQDKVAMKKSNKSLLTSMLGSMKRKKKEEKQTGDAKKSEDFSHDKKEIPPLSSTNNHNEVVGKGGDRENEETQHSQVPDPQTLEQNKVTPYKKRKTKSFDLSSTFNSFKQVASKPLRRANSVPSTIVPENKGNVRNKGNFSGFLGKFTSGGIGKKRKRPSSKNAGIADAAGGAEMIPKTGEKKKKLLTRSAGHSSSSRCLGLWGCHTKDQRTTQSSTSPDTVSQDGDVGVPITVQEARHIIADIYALQYYTDYAKNSTLEEENAPTKNLPFDVRLFLRRKMIEVVKPGEKKLNGRRFRKEPVKGFAVEVMEQSGEKELNTVIHPTSASELFKIDAWRITGKMTNKHADTSTWTIKFAHLAKMVDADCAKIGSNHGKGEHALCILARLFTFGAAIDHQVRTNQGQVYTKLDQQKAQWLLVSAVEIFKHFVPISKRLRKNKEAMSVADKLMAKYEAIFHIQLEGKEEKNGEGEKQKLSGSSNEKPSESYIEDPLENHKENPSENPKENPSESHNEEPSKNDKKISSTNPYTLPNAAYMKRRHNKFMVEKVENPNKLPLPPGYNEILKRKKLKEEEEERKKILIEEKQQRKNEEKGKIENEPLKPYDHGRKAQKEEEIGMVKKEEKEMGNSEERVEDESEETAEEKDNV